MIIARKNRACFSRMRLSRSGSCRIGRSRAVPYRLEPLWLTSSWSFTYTSGAPYLFLQSITLDLSPTDLTFDTAPRGYLAYQDIGGFGGTDGTTGLSPTYLSGAALNGGNE